jgi:SNF2 family DNA or RNA helicase
VNPPPRSPVPGRWRGRPGRWLLVQIEAGGVGLNLQAASVVIICEPQVKPTWER